MARLYVEAVVECRAGQVHQSGAFAPDWCRSSTTEPLTHDQCRLRSSGQGWKKK